MAPRRADEKGGVGHGPGRHDAFSLPGRGGIATVSLNRPDRKNPLTFDSYAELRDWFRALPYTDEVKAVVFASNGGISAPAAMCMTSSGR